MSNISSIQNLQSTSNTHNLLTTSAIDTSLLELAKGALTAMNVGQLQGNGVKVFFQQPSLELSFLQNNASLSLLHAIEGINQEMSLQELSALYFENGQLRDEYDLLLADVFIATFLVENINKALDSNKFFQELKELANNVQDLMLTTDKVSAQKNADTIEKILEKLETQVPNYAKNTISSLRLFLNNKMEYLQRIDTVQSTMQEIITQGKFKNNFPSEMNKIQINNDNTIFGLGILAFAEKKLSPVFDELRLNNLLQHLIINDEYGETVEKLYANASDKEKAVIEDFSSKVLQELKANLNTNSLTEVFTLFPRLEVFAQRVMLIKDKEN